jgi:methylated-DNA-protein-cysteine methyltransferase-like protein
MAISKKKSKSKAPVRPAKTPAKPAKAPVRTGKSPARTKSAQPKKPTRSQSSKSAPIAREKLSVLKPSGKKEDSFFELVHEVACQIPKGRVTSYGAIAACLGTRLSARMVGWAMNAVPLSKKSVPAHRVVNSMGLLTGKHHFNPPGRMQELLEKEGIFVKNDKVVDFKELFWDPSKEL